MEKIKIAIAGLGNCASSLLQGIEYYRRRGADDAVGLMHWEIGGYQPSDMQVVAAFDIDERKIGKDVSEAMFSPPNCTKVFCPDMPVSGVKVSMGRILDGFSEHLSHYDPQRSFRPSDAPQPDKDRVVGILKEAGAQVMLNYLPVGSEEATRFYAECALFADVALINCIPVFIASHPQWAERFRERGLPLIGDDIKSQLGATIIHRTLADLFKKRGVKLERTYQLNTGGNTDFLNMLNRSRLASKKLSKTEAVQSVLATRLADENIHIGPSDYVPWQKDNKVCFLRMEGQVFGNIPMHLEMRLSVEDSPNSAGVAIDAIRCCQIARQRRMGGTLIPASAFFMKHPLQQFPDDEAYRLLESFLCSDHSD